MPKEVFHCISVSVMLIDYVFWNRKKPLSMSFLKECKYIFKVKKIETCTESNCELINSDESDEKDFSKE